MSELKELGFDTNANLGLGFDELELAGLEVGDAGLRQVFADFCERWGWGVRSLLQDANQFAERLNLSAGMYHEQEQYVSNTLKTVWSSTMGTPSLTETPEEIAQRSWSDTLQDNPVSQAMNPDFSAESVRAADEASKHAWDQAMKDVATSTLTPDAPFDPNTEWQPDGPSQASFGEVER
ncbi:hypothetical protein [Streptomyces caeruleatus]|uniref:Uncharacterized protein n=1 Tax=Streptomyces caeruleatus TaxID=661399 RepID=A0A101TT23_9ACTN|nr:hypothetical protein [Streptomyces caeruleatus]KUN97959.1 hypothetical protein AQJ67_28695 [Streptomyces caeruleatus]